MNFELRPLIVSFAVVLAAGSASAAESRDAIGKCFDETTIVVPDRSAQPPVLFKIEADHIYKVTLPSDGLSSLPEKLFPSEKDYCFGANYSHFVNKGSCQKKPAKFVEASPSEVNKAIALRIEALRSYFELRNLTTEKLSKDEAGKLHLRKEVTKSSTELNSCTALLEKDKNYAALIKSAKAGADRLTQRLR